MSNDDQNSHTDISISKRIEKQQTFKIYEHTEPSFTIQNEIMILN